jgi:hypothetical protein
MDHHRNFVQESNGWDNQTWQSINLFTFGKHFKCLRPSHRSQHFKFVHDHQPLGERHFREAPVKSDVENLPLLSNGRQDSFSLSSVSIKSVLSGKP